jgi:tetratricopeptide (TPR) repeat protein
LAERWPIGLVVVALAVLASPLAHADRQKTRRANEHRENGLAAYKAEDYAAAAAEFAAAYALVADRGLLFAWAQAERLAGNCEKAIDLYAKFLESDPGKRDRKAATLALTACADQVKQLEAERAAEAKAKAEAQAQAEAEARAKAEAEQQGAAAAASVSARAPEPRLTRLSAFARVDMDGTTRSGAVLAPGIAIRIARSPVAWEVLVAGLVGGNAGFEPGARVSFGSGALRPSVVVAAPLFFAEGLRPGVRGAAGVLIGLFGSWYASVEVGVAHALSVPDGIQSTVLLGSVGLELRI